LLSWTTEEASSEEQTTSQYLASRIFPAVAGDRHWDFLDNLGMVSDYLNDESTKAMLHAIQDMTKQDAIDLQQADELKPTLDMYFDQMRIAFDQWLTTEFTAVLQRVMDAAAN